MTEQLAETAPVTGSVVLPLRLQVAKEVVEASAVKLTVPVGVVAAPGVASVTVAVQVELVPKGTLEQLTLVVVSCLVTVRPVEPELPWCEASPP